MIELMRDKRIVEEYKQREEAWENAYVMNRIAFVRKIEELNEIQFVVLQRNELHKMMGNLDFWIETNRNDILVRLIMKKELA